jgi:hypothetical protein
MLCVEIGWGKAAWCIVLRHDTAELGPAVSCLGEREQLHGDFRVRVWDGCLATILSIERHVEWLYVNSYFVYGLNIGLFAGCSEVFNFFNA